MRKLIIAAATTLALAAGVAFAAGQAEHPHDEPFSFDSPFGTYDMASVQRGFAVYNQVCAACHSMNYLSYRHLGEEGGPFALYMVRDHATGEEAPHIGKPAHGGTFVPVTDNPYVRSIASAVQIPDTDPNDGSQIERPGRISDHFRRPFPNEAAARASNGGAYPPDLSVITSARHGGADYIYALLSGYTGETSPAGTQWVNPYFPGQLISMPPPLVEGAVTFEDGTEATVPQMARDVTTFLQWAADPHMETRKKTGFVALIFLAILAGLLYLSYKAVWRNESH